MADTKITALTALTAADPANDVIPIVDVSDTSMAASGTTKKISVNNILSSSPTASGALTVTGLVTAGSASITGAATVGTTLGVTGNLTVQTNKLAVTTTGVGCGTASPSEPLHVNKSSGTGTFIRLQDSANSNYIGTDNGNFRVLNGASPVYDLLKIEQLGVFTFGDGAGGTRMTLNSTGNLVFPSAKGIDFSAVTGGTGTATANVLNDYEEGTFTPTVAGTTTAGVGVYGVQMGRYTKVGNLVSVQVYISWSAHTGTGNLRFSGLPFNVSADANYYSAVTFGFVSDLALTASNILTAYASTGSANIDAHQYPVGGGSSTAVPMDGAAAIIYSVTYKVA